MTEYATEIHRLLKLGDNTVLPSFHGAPEGLPIAHTEIAKNVSRLKNLIIYPVIFIVAFAFFFTVLNFSSIVSQVNGFFATKPQDEQILGQKLDEYYRWIGNYYYAVTDGKLLDPNNDIDKDGLSNHDEFIMRTNPIVADSDSDGFFDGIEVINSYNPWGSGVMTKQQKDLLVDLDVIMINNRISFNVSQNKGTVEAINKSNFDLNKPGIMSIPKLNLRVPLIWSRDPADFEKDLSKGVVHYPGTSLPGEIGTIYVSGHSSDYIWKKDEYAQVFAKLNFLRAGDDVFVDVYGLDGKVYNFRYQVTGNAVYKPDDQAQFVDMSTYKLNLSTCWPIGTSKDRLVVSAIQVGL